mgnify:CR=1 FL=1
MEPITRWFVQNKVAANMMMIFIIIAGFVTIPYIKMEVFPAIEVDVINVSIVYPGASPSDIEESICVRVEERLQGLEGIKKITSTASENLAVISVEILPEQDVEDMLDKVKAQVDAITIIFLIIYLIFMIWGGWESFMYSLSYGGERSSSIWRPYIWPIKLIMLFGLSLMLLQSISEFFKDILRIKGYDFGEKN